MIVTAVATCFALSSCGSASHPDAVPANVIAERPNVSAAATASGPKEGPASTQASPVAPGKPSPDTPEQRANDLIACEAMKNSTPGKPAAIAADALPTAKAKLAMDPKALEKCRAS